MYEPDANIIAKQRAHLGQAIAGGIGAVEYGTAGFQSPPQPNIADSLNSLENEIGLATEQLQAFLRRLEPLFKPIPEKKQAGNYIDNPGSPLQQKIHCQRDRVRYLVDLIMEASQVLDI